MSTDPPTPSKLAQTSGGISKRFAARDVNNRGKHWPAERVHVHIAENYSNRKGNMSSCAYLFSTQTFAGRWRQLPDRDRKALRKMHIHFHSSSGGELPYQTCINDVPVKKKGLLIQRMIFIPTKKLKKKGSPTSCPRSGAVGNEEDFHVHIIICHHMQSQSAWSGANRPAAAPSRDSAYRVHEIWLYNLEKKIPIANAWQTHRVRT